MGEEQEMNRGEDGSTQLTDAELVFMCVVNVTASYADFCKGRADERARLIVLQDMVSHIAYHVKHSLPGVIRDPEISETCNTMAQYAEEKLLAAQKARRQTRH